MTKPCSPPRIDITYAAHTASCTFLLDSEGICRRIVVAPSGKRREGSRTAAKCVGAQYVASLDGSAAGGLVEMPRVGAAMLFARVDEHGRVSLVRTGPVTSFESKAAEDPFVGSATVETSAPDLSLVHESRTERGHGARELSDPYDDEVSDRTQRIPALHSEDITRALGGEEGIELSTAEYRAIDDDEDDYRPTLVPATSPSASRGMLPRRSDPYQRAAAAAAPARAPRSYAPPARASDVQISRRRRGL